MLTVVGNDPSLIVVDDNRRYVTFDPPTSANPRVLGLGDLDAALASGKDFARKFDALAALDEIDRRVHS